MIHPSGPLGQTVLIIGTCTGAGLEAARRAKGEGAQLILTDCRAGSLEDVADEIGVEATAAIDDGVEVAARADASFV
jgi:NADP-dependent 3-hydroxy acid dehydrogenase YdfG